MDNVKQLLRRRQKALDLKKQWEPMLQKTYRYSQPNRNIFDMVSIGAGGDQKLTSGSNINWYVFDLTLAHATDVYVNRQINALTPAGKRWLNFIAGTDIPEQNKEDVNRILQNNTDKFFQVLHQSNFQLVIHECFMDMVVSTGFLVANRGFDDRNPYIFASLPPDKTYASEGPYGTFDAFYRDWYKLDWEHMEAMWPGVKKPSTRDEVADEPLEFTVYEIIYMDYNTYKWEQVLIDEASKEKLYSRTHNSSPIVGFRAKKLSGEVYGRGPAMDAMPTGATINQAMYDEIMSANFRALPIYMGFGDGVFNPETFKVVPNTIISCSPVTSGTWPLQPVPPAGDINWSALVISDLREQIQRIMLTNPFGAVDDPKKTATEIIERQREIVENSSAAFSRIQRELFDPLVERIVDLMRENGDWIDPEVDGKIIAVKYETPLVMSQGQKDVLDFLQFDAFVKQIVGEEAADAFYNLELVMPWMSEKLNIKLDLVKTSSEIVQVFEQAQENMQAMEEQQ